MQFRDKRGLGRVAVGAAFLGLLFGAHAAALWCGALPAQWCLYALSLTAFHFLEFVATALHQPGEVTFDSFLLNHSPAYRAAALASWAEFWVEARWAPWLKGWGAAPAAGLCLVVGGQALRAAAMHTAGSNFTHLVATERRRGHALVTRGVYAWLRHPAYDGWAAWAVGTQLLLGNPLCVGAYAAATWAFFAGRIPGEEEALLRFFGGAYAEYARRTRILIPGMFSPAREVAVEEAERLAEEAAAAEREAEGRAPDGAADNTE
jgi:protein-S-isoprenylcysteine O-methyltransferase